MTTLDQRLASHANLDYRASKLRSIAERWDPTILEHDRWLEARDFTRAEKNRSIDLLIDHLTRYAAEAADPGMSYVDIRAYMEALRDAIHALARFECGDGWDGDEDDEKVYYPAETVVTLLNADIDYALWPLISGEFHGNLCHRCSRSNKAPQRWNSRLPGYAFCAEHQS